MNKQWCCENITKRKFYIGQDPQKYASVLPSASFIFSWSSYTSAFNIYPICLCPRSHSMNSSQTNNMVLRVSRPIVQNTLPCVLTLPCDLLPELLLISQPFLPYILLPPLSLRSFCLFSLPHLRLPDYLFSCPFFAFTLVIISELWLLPRHTFRAQISSRKTCPFLKIQIVKI